MRTMLVAFTLAAALLAQAASADTLGRIKSSKSINVAYSPDSLPFSFNGPNNAPSGACSR